MNALARITVRRDVDRATFEAEIAAAAVPVVLEDVAADWPMVRAARESSGALARMLKSLDGGRQPHLIEAPPGVNGRIFYSDDLSAFNFTRRPAGIGETLDLLLRLAEVAEPPAIFLESMSAKAYLPEFPATHRMPLLDERIEPRIWIGNAVKVNTHFDLACNIACVVGGRRRFTLFPPGQLANLYMAPLDFTPSGAPVSLVQFTQPDHARFPRYAEALRHAQQAELGPGDALFIPYGWWHHVESLTPFNVLVNYWWNPAPDYGAPHGALLHALLTIRDLPADQRAVWQSLFQQLVFADPESALAHLAPARRGMLAPPSPERTRKIRETLARDFRRTEI
ncbi:MAG TPA: cupin-like domain-containing protein [Steroidobacteraceae bacterium]|nr:cupin-like domain-containing protein [Steroidobacteraceae bacterium]